MKKNLRFLTTTLVGVMVTTNILPSITSMASIKENDGLEIVSMSDLHYFAEELAGDKGPAFQEYLKGDRKMLTESVAILDAAIDKVIAQKPDVVLIPGDLTKDSEQLGHERVAEKLSELEDNGIEVFVINGNHDINHPDAVRFEGDSTYSVDTALPDEFKDIYSDFGYEQAIATHEDSLSYVAELKPGYRLIAIDSGIYGSTEDTKYDQRTAGRLTADLESWILDQINIAKAEGDQVIGMMHHAIVEQFAGQATIFAPYVVDENERLSELFADAGMEYLFSGHFHAQSISQKTTAKGNSIFDIATGSLVTAPCPIRTVELDKDINRFKVTSDFITEVKGIENFPEYADEFLAAGIPDMVVNLLIDILTGSVTYEGRSGESIDLNSIIETIGQDNIDALIQESIKSEIIDGEEFANKEFMPSQTQLMNYLKVVITSLKEAKLNEEWTFMDVVQYCLKEVYAGDQEYSEELNSLIEEMKTPSQGMKKNIVRQFVIKLLSSKDAKAELGDCGLADLLNSLTLGILFDAVKIENQPLELVISGALIGLIDSLLTDPAPGDNNILLYDAKSLTTDRVIDIINTLPEDITLENELSIRKARSMYNDLSESEKNLVNNIDKLVAAEKVVSELKVDINAAQNVIDMIAKLPENIVIENKEAVTDARKAYNSLTEKQKTLVTNLDKLIKAEAIIAELEKNNNSGNTDNSTNNSGTSNNGVDNNKKPSTGDTSSRVLGGAFIALLLSGLAIRFREKIYTVLKVNQ